MQKSRKEIGKETLKSLNFKEYNKWIKEIKEARGKNLDKWLI